MSPSAAPSAAVVDVSPEVLRELHHAWVRQQRNSAVGGALVTAAAAALAAALGGQSLGMLWLVVAIMGAQTVLAANEWWSARKVDPVSAALDAPAEAELERVRGDAFRARLAERRAPITISLVVIVTAVTVIEWFTAGSTARTVARAGLVKLLVSDGEWWRLGTSTFVHAGLFHLVGNIAVLGAFGRIVEAYTSRSWLLVTYAVAGLAGGLVSWWWTPAAASLGASGAVMGVVAFAAVVGWRHRAEFPAGIRRGARMTITATVFVGALSFGFIDNGAHVGGALAGALLALVATALEESRATSRAIAVLGGVCALAIIVSGGQAVIALASGPAAVLNRVPASVAAAPIQSASARLERDGRELFVRLTNHGAQSLEAYQVTMPFAGSLWRDDCCIASDNLRPVPPGDSIRLPLDGFRTTRIAAPVLSVAVFADGSYEGDPRAHHRIVIRRRQTLTEATFWMRKIAIAMTLPPAEAATRLSAYADIRLMETDGWDTPRTALGIANLIRVAREEPARFPSEAARTKAQLLDVHSALSARLKSSR